MNPVGDYYRLWNQVNRNEKSGISTTFGILIGDFRQRRCQEYVLNYIERFHTKSGKYINFYIPGYIDDDSFETENKITIKGKNYYFDSNLYNEFLTKLEEKFDIPFTYNPLLILMEYNGGKFGESKRIVIDLDSYGSDIENTGDLFENIFDIASSNVSIQKFSSELKSQQFKNGVFDKIVDSININALKNIQLVLKGNNRYKLVNK